LLGSTTVTTTYFVLKKYIGGSEAKKHIKKLLLVFDVAPVDRTVLTDALLLDFNDYEDAVLHEAALKAGAEGIVTRDQTGFGNATLRIYSPEELLKLVQSMRSSS